MPVATVGQEPAARRQARADRMDEILQTVGASALGLTIGCARCHNHKFDPISIKDYYSMSAAFQDIEFGSRFPELGEDHPRRIRGQELYAQIAEQRRQIRKTGPWQEDWVGLREFHFPVRTTQSVRITFQWAGVRIDELEILGPLEWNRNLALESNGTKTAAESKFEQLRGELHKINDGHYGTEGWAAKAPPNSKQKPWVQFTFDQPYAVNRIRVSTNREDFMQTDYLDGMGKLGFGPLTIEIMNDDGNWEKVLTPGQLKQLDKKHESRVHAVQQLNELIRELSEQGPKPSFIGQLI